jgi:type I restriction enzyme S subunit
MKKMSQGLLRTLQICVPPLDEQQGIAEFATRTTAICDTLIVEAERAISLLQERRTALISAAVTGKIDVRGLAEAA